MSDAWVTAIGMMSGTSMDGVDAALVKSDGRAVQRVGVPVSVAYEDAERGLIQSTLGGTGDVLAAERTVTLKHIDCVDVLLNKNDITRGKVDVIGFHGQTIVHRPEEGMTWQIGDAALLAARTGIDVISDFRRHDMALGGEGAPFAPLYHAALVGTLDRRQPVCVLNLGGVANVTWIDGDTVLAFDTGPSGALLDDWVRRHSDLSFDRDGKIAAAGTSHDARVVAVLQHPYFDRPPPKSLDRNAFDIDLAGLSLADGAATLVELTARTLASAVDHMPAPPTCWIACGGNRLNPAILRAISRHVAGDVMCAEDVGWNGDAVEAEAFAYLAVRSLNGLPLSLPTTTGVGVPATGGAHYRANTTS